MDIQSLIKLWPKYQAWLKENNITTDNIQQKIPEFVAKVRNNPQDSQKLDQLLYDPNLAGFAKSLNIPESKLEEVRNMAQPRSNGVSSSHNLTKEQLDFIKRNRR